MRATRWSPRATVPPGFVVMAGLLGSLGMKWRCLHFHTERTPQTEDSPLMASTQAKRPLRADAARKREDVVAAAVEELAELAAAAEAGGTPRLSLDRVAVRAGV